jgi:hypothetical protein
VQVHQLVLSTVIGKHGILAQFGLTAPVATVLRSLEGAIDVRPVMRHIYCVSDAVSVQTLATGLIRLIPCATDTVNAGQNMLDTSVISAISIYAQFCVPSVLYPQVQPVCIAL